MKDKLKILFYVAAATTAIAGMLHVVLGVDNNNLNTQLLFVVGGLTQIFWIIPMIKKWGRPWYLVGLGGTAVFVAIWTITRFQDNPITGRAGRISENAILVEIFQITFIAITIAILAFEKRK